MATRSDHGGSKRTSGETLVVDTGKGEKADIADGRKPAVSADEGASSTSEEAKRQKHMRRKAAKAGKKACEAAEAAATAAAAIAVESSNERLLRLAVLRRDALARELRQLPKGQRMVRNPELRQLQYEVYHLQLEVRTEIDPLWQQRGDH